MNIFWHYLAELFPSWTDSNIFKERGLGSIISYYQGKGQQQIAGLVVVMQIQGHTVICIFCFSSPQSQRNVKPKHTTEDIHNCTKSFHSSPVTNNTPLPWWYFTVILPYGPFTGCHFYITILLNSVISYVFRAINRNCWDNWAGMYVFCPPTVN